jgi:hypothetical protein
MKKGVTRAGSVLLAVASLVALVTCGGGGEQSGRDVVRDAGADSADIRDDPNESPVDTYVAPQRPDPRQVCQDYIECASKTAPAYLGEILATYGAQGSCWMEAQDESLCAQACLTGLQQSREAHPDELACPGCFVNADCAANDGGHACEAEKGRCVECVTDEDCGSAERSVCEGATHQCSATPQSWRPCVLPLDPGESIVDWIGYTVNDVRTLFWLTDWGRFGRIQPGEAAERLHLYSSQTPQAFRGLWTADGKSFWVVGQGNTVWKGMPTLPTELSLNDELTGEWTGVWGNGTSVIWLTGKAGVYLRLDADGKNPRRFVQGANEWRSPTGDDNYAWFLSYQRVMRVTNGTDFVDNPSAGVLALANINQDQTGVRLVAIDPTHLYLVGAPYQLVRGFGENAISFGAPIFSGVNPFYDLHGLPGGHRLVVGAKGELHELDANDAELDPPAVTAGLPEAEDLKRVWLFDDGSAYVLSASSGVFYREPK